MKYKFQKMMPYLMTAVMLLAGTSLTACSAEPDEKPADGGTAENQEVPQNEPEKEPAAKPEEELKGPFTQFTAQDLEGNEVTQDIFSDYDLTVVNIWGTFCGPCINEMPELGELSKDYADKGVQIVGLVGDTVDGSGAPMAAALESAKEIVSKTQADFTHVIPTGELFTNVMSQISSFPTTIFVDSEGNQVGSGYIGARNKEQWSKLIDQALADMK